MNTDNSVDNKAEYHPRHHQHGGPQRFAPPAPPSAPERPSYLSWVFSGIMSLFRGMRITLSKFVDPRTTVTQSYPENRKELKLPKRFRGEVIMPHNEEGEHNCTGCTLCEQACPNGSISILQTKHISGKKILGRFVYRLDSCTMCTLCVEACPFGAIEMGGEFEHATSDREGLVKFLNKKEGRV